jgi:hypothetical protein
MKSLLGYLTPLFINFYHIDVQLFPPLQAGEGEGG